MIALEVTDTRWAEFVESCPAAISFHHPSWAGLLAECYGYRAFALARTGADGRIVAGLPIIEVCTPLRSRRWVSLPFTDRCPPLVPPGLPLADLVQEMDATRRDSGVSRLEIRSTVEGPGASVGRVAVMHRLGLDQDPDTVYGGFRRSGVRKWITRAEGSGVTIRWADSRLALVDTFYRLHLGTRRRQGVPVQPRRYFDLLWRELIKPGLGFVLLAYAGGTPIAGAVFLAWKGTVIYKYGASDAAYWGLHPNHLLMWTAIRWGCERGFQAFDFGRSDLGSKGLRQFKDSWGSEETDLVYTTIGGQAAQPPGGRLHEAMSLVVRRSPTWVCRTLGEMLYRYAA
jgi:CelD/BcsL family acetyltransferase involved in cellulose biosynthesis